MTTLVDDLVPDQLWALVSPLLPPPPRPPYGGRRLTIPTATAWPRSSTWPAPPPHGGCCQPASLAAARRRPAGGAWPSGGPRGCLTSCTSRSWTGWASRVGWTGRGPAWTA